MHIHDLEEFITLSESDSYFEASEKLFISSSVLSKHISRLEAELGHTLFERTTRRARINEYGRLFLPYAKRIIAAYNEGVTEFRRFDQLTSKTIRLGLLPPFGNYNIPKLIHSFRETHPDCKMEISQETSGMLISHLLSGRYDFIFCHLLSSLENADVPYLPFAQDQFCVLASTSSPLADKEEIDLNTLANYAVYTTGNELWKDFQHQALEKHGINLNLSSMPTDASNLMQMISESPSSLGLMIEKAANNDILLQGIKVKKLTLKPQFRSRIVFCYPSEQHMSALSRAFLNHVKLYLEKEE